MRERMFFGVRDQKGNAFAFVSRPGEGMSLLPLRNDLMNHSPCGAEWGYGGSGPAQLSIGILMEVVGSWETVQPIYHDFKFEVIARLPRGVNWESEASRGRSLSEMLGETVEEWRLTETEVLGWLKKQGVRR